MDSLSTTSWLTGQVLRLGSNQFSLTQIVSLLPFLSFVTPNAVSKLAFVRCKMLDRARMIWCLVRMLRDIVIRL